MKKTSLMIIGDDAIAVDTITMNVLNLELEENDLIKKARNKNINGPKSSSIRILGNKIEEINTNIDLCVSNIEEVKVRNLSIKSGEMCSGCFKQAYHLLNLIKTYMSKDLKYNINNSFLIGETPEEPDKIGNIILFGDCAVNSTKNFNFRKIKIESKKKPISEAKDRILGGKKPKKKKNKETKIKVKPNKKILELSGCPPDIFISLESILKYYGKKN